MPAFDGTTAGNTGWVTPPLLSGWATFGGEEPFAYCRLNGVVYMTGLIGGGAANTAWLFLPPGFRPRITTGLNRIQQSIFTAAGPRVMFIRNDGALYMPDYSAAGGGYVFVNDVRPFPADA